MPMFFVAEPQNTGTVAPLAMPFLSAAVISSAESSSPSRYLFSRSSSASATASTSCSRAAATAEAMSAGTSAGSPFSPVKALFSTTLITPEKLSCEPMGMVSGAIFLP